MCLVCRDCGISLTKNPSGRNTPKRCHSCQKERQLRTGSLRQKELVRSKWEGNRCVDCGGSIAASPRRGPMPKRCGKCMAAAELQRSRQRRAGGRHKIHANACVQCGMSFKTGIRKQKYCSPQCGQMASRDRKRICCQACGGKFDIVSGLARNRKFCSRTCWIKSRVSPQCTCHNCGNAFARKSRKYPWQGKNMFCSRECAWDHRWGADRPRSGGTAQAKKAWANKSRLTTLRHRCRHFGCSFDPDCTRETVCDRDGLVCQTCGVHCHKGECRLIPGTRQPDPRNAEHDHIWPLSRPGGPGNVMSNSQCLCRKCNGRKRAKSGGQLRLAYTA